MKNFLRGKSMRGYVSVSGVKTKSIKTIADNYATTLEI